MDPVYTGYMSQLTRRDIAEVVEEVLDRKLDEKLDKRFAAFEDKIDRKFDTRFAESEVKMDSKMGFFIEHMDDKFDSLAEAISLMGTNMKALARKSDLDEVKSDIKTIKIAVKETNKDIHRLEDRFDRFELSYL